MAKQIPIESSDCIPKSYFTTYESNNTGIMNRGTPPELRGGFPLLLHRTFTC